MVRKMLSLAASLCVASTLAAAPAAARGRAAAQGARVIGRQVVGTVVGIGGRTAGRTRPFTLYVDRVTSAEDVGRLNEALRRGGDDEMLSVLRRMEAGRIVIGNNVGLPANAILADRQADGTLRLVVLFERNVNFYELRYGTRSEDYRFGYAELFLDTRDRGEGTFIPAARVRLRDGNTWEVEDFGVFPARIMGVRVMGGRVRAR